MRCPRCTLAELSDTTETCVLCGYSPAAVAVAEAPPALPTELDARRELAHAFRIESLLEAPPGQIVYAARDAQDRAVALKVVPLAQVGGEATAHRFDTVAGAAAGLDHPHIVPVYGHGATENFLWCATKHVEGRALGTILRTAGPIELPVCLRIFEQVASALDYVHRRNMAHGALTPDSIIVDANQWALVTDFAWAGVLDAAPFADGPRASGPATHADQRALALIAYECLTGSPPPEGRATLDEGNPPLPLHVSQALRRALSKRPADRFGSVLDFVAALGGGGGAGGAAAGGPGARRDGQKAWFSATPRKTPGNAPVVIVDADADPAASGVGKRIVAVLLGLVIVVGGGAAWLGITSIPAAPPLREPSAAPTAASPARAPVSAAPIDRGSSGDTVVQAAPPPLASSPPPATPAPPQARPRPAEAESPRVARPPARRAAPQVAVAPPPASAPAPIPDPGLLSVNAIPWGSVYLDGRPIGNTPLIDLTVSAGQHRLRVEREGFRPYDRMIQVAPGQRLRITDIALVER